MVSIEGLKEVIKVLHVGITELKILNKPDIVKKGIFQAIGYKEYQEFY